MVPPGFWMQLKLKPTIIPATIADYPVVQNMARFYVYDRTLYMGWECPENGLFDCIDFKHYFENPNERAFVIKVNNELAGFVLLDKAHLIEQVDWNMGEFFILAKFQGKGIASMVARDIFKEHPGKWSVAVMPENSKALNFWRKVIFETCDGDYNEVFKTEEELKSADNPDPYAMNVITFAIDKEKTPELHISIHQAKAADIENMVILSYAKRRDYEKAQPQFWRYAEGAEVSQTEWFQELLNKDDHIFLVAKSQSQVIGFIIGRIVIPPEVYNPGLTLMVDDFCVSHSSQWSTVGSKLLTELKRRAQEKGAQQVLVVCGAHDQPKRHFLQGLSLTAASEWYVGKIE